MNPVIKKLGLKNQKTVLVVNAPAEYKSILEQMPVNVHKTIDGKYEFIQIFALNINEGRQYAEKSVNAIDGDGHLWLCYPKGTSKKYKSDLNRNTVLDLFAPINFEGVTQIAIDEDWSALRVRHVDNIRQMKRKSAKTEKGNERIKKNII
jgi:hypothetical protein